MVDAFLAAAHNGDLAALVAVLDPDVVRTDCATPFAALSGVRRGAEAVASQALAAANPAAPKLPVLVNGAADVVVMFGGQPFAVMGFTIADGKIVEINTILDPERVRRLDLSALD